MSGKSGKSKAAAAVIEAEPVVEAAVEAEPARDAIVPYDVAVAAAKAGTMLLPIMTDAGILVDVS